MVKNSIQSVSADVCVGCGACAAACPVGAISLQVKDGFYYPCVDENKCVDCEKCRKACAVIKTSPRNVALEYYAGYMEPAKMAKHSTSGGLCTEIIKQYLLKGHAVYASAFDEEWKLAHRRVNGLEELDRFSGSKYMQSSIEANIYQEIADELKQGRKCLFIGSPCQVGALVEYLNLNKVDSDNLLTVDFMCHGVPSPVLGQKFIQHLEKKKGKKISYYNFRSKAYGWGGLDRTLEFADGSESLTPASVCPLHSWFGRHLSIRKSCFNCQYRTKQRVSDLTVADFWGINKHYPEIPTKQGVSAIQINSPKGKEIYEYLRNSCGLISYEVVENALWDRKTELNNYPRPQNYDVFWQSANTLPVKALIKKFPPQTTVGYLRQFVKSILRRHLR